ncbi:MAG: hypothetical protein GXY07_08695 [Candidatus Hydrogenedentes bacterium]|jgi:phosphate-selective porin OprO/OprP|nr:hypothetical protein [Candidatus Hydrogenedentota bacterium]
MIHHRFLFFLPALMALAFPEFPLHADDGGAVLTAREEVLLERIEQLERRLAEVEARLEGATVSPGATTDTSADVKMSTPTGKPAVAKPPEKADTGTDTPTPLWRNGLCFESGNGAFQMKVGGRLHLDYAFVDQDGPLSRRFGPIFDTGEFRRARIRLQGTMYEHFDYRMEFDFAGDGSGKFTDVWMQMGNIPFVGTFKAGHFREPAGLDEQTSDDYLTFMERNLATALLPGRNLGIMLQNTLFDKRLGWTLGAFKEVGAFPGPQDAANGYAYTGRITGLPWYRDDGRQLLHLGLSYSRRLPDGGSIGYQTRPEIHLVSNYLNTEIYRGFRLRDANVDKEDLINLEAAWVFGAFSLQGEYVRDRIETRLDGSPVLSGAYLEASYFLTGEHRVYNRSSATFDRVVPHHNFSPKSSSGWGAWQLALRRSRLDLNSGAIKGGEADNWTLGLNWYLNPNVRLILNYVISEIDHDLYSGRVNSLQTRLQFNF